MKAILRNWEFVLFSLITLLLLAPIWYFSYFPTVDGPSHIANAFNLKKLLNGECPELSSFYRLNPLIIPNYTGFIIIAFTGLFASPEIADKIFLSLYTLLFTLGLWRLIKTVNPRSQFMVFLALPFAFNSLFFFGNYNFLLSIAFYFYIFNWWLTAHENLSAKKFILSTLALLLLYYTHIFGTFVFCVSVAAALVYEFIADRNFKKFITASIFYFCAAIPMLALLYFYMQLPKTPVEGDDGMGFRLLTAFFATSLYGIAVKARLTVVIYSTFVWILVVFRLICFRTGSRYNCFLLLSSIFFLCILFFPAAFAGSWMIEPRFQLVMWLTLIIWLAAGNYPAIIKFTVTGISLCIIFYSIYTVFDAAKKYDKTTSEIMRVGKYIPDHSTIFYVNLSPYTIDYATGETNVRIQIPPPLGYLTAKTCIIDAENYHSSEMNVFPISYKDSVNPFIHLGEFRNINSLLILPPRINIAGYEKQTGKKIDYVIVGGRRENLLHYDPQTGLDENELYKNFMAQIDANFIRQDQPQSPIVSIYKRKPSL